MERQTNTSTGEASWRERYRSVRHMTRVLCAPLAVEDYVVQSRTEVSPPKWHLAHTSWFFEQFVLQEFLPGYRIFHPQYHALFNSYYQSLGTPFPRPQRGLLSRPTVDEIYRYRAWVDEAMDVVLDRLDGDKEQNPKEFRERVELGMHHEQQHQELLLMDIKHNFSINPLRPAYRPPAGTRDSANRRPAAWRRFTGGDVTVGAADSGFAFDNERPRHRVILRSFALAPRLVTQGEYHAFMADDGYHRPELWLADGWARREQEGWEAPLYWLRDGPDWMQMTLSGLQPLSSDEPVAHVSYFEADAFARWAGKRLPSEHEWEHAASGVTQEGNFLESGWLHPQPADTAPLAQLFGDLWEWTASPYVAYPGYRRATGAFGEYNGKFMCNQWVMRGGACVTPRSHLRATYRNFFYPWDRWQFGGIRLAEDL